MLVAGTGTGGTISGIARKLKEKVPNIQVVFSRPMICHRGCKGVLTVEGVVWVEIVPLKNGDIARI